MKKYIDEYFEKQGIKVIYNTLGHTDELVNAYVKETYDMFANSKAKFTNAIKGGIYNKFYNLTPRIKKTGFEYLQAKDDNFRRIAVPPAYRDLWNTPSHAFEVFKNDGQSYKDCLKQHLLKIENPLLFYSGGIDSELVLQTFLDVGVKPAIAIFEMYDLQGVLINEYDIKYAYDFCKKHNLVPIVKKICPESLWDQSDFISLGRELKIGSPQILTHVWMIKMISEEVPNHTYCFAGEIRYTDYDKFSIGKTVLVGSVKNDPGMAAVYTSNSNTGAGTTSITLITNSSTVLVGGAAYWEVLQLSTNDTGTPIFGYYSDQTRPPDFNYEFAIDWTENQDDQGPDGSLSGTTLSFVAGDNVFFTPTNSNTTNSNSVLFGVAISNSLSGYVADYSFIWKIRNATSPGTVVTGSSQFVASVN